MRKTWASVVAIGLSLYSDNCNPMQGDAKDIYHPRPDDRPTVVVASSDFSTVSGSTFRT